MAQWTCENHGNGQVDLGDVKTYDEASWADSGVGETVRAGIVRVAASNWKQAMGMESKMQWLDKKGYPVQGRGYQGVAVGAGGGEGVVVEVVVVGDVSVLYAVERDGKPDN